MCREWWKLRAGLAYVAGDLGDWGGGRRATGSGAHRNRWLTWGQPLRSVRTQAKKNPAEAGFFMKLHTNYLAWAST